MEQVKSKKILMTLMRLEIGGAETHVLELSLELKRQGYDVIVASGGGVYETYLKEAGIPHYTVPMYTKNPVKMFQSILELKKIIRDEKIDIVHAHGRIPAFLCGVLHTLVPFTFVTTAHWVFRTSFGFRQLTNWGQKVMAVSEDIKTYLIENYGTNPEDIFVTINGIDTNRFSPEREYSSLLTEFSLSEDSTKIVYISRMDEDRALVAFHLAEIADKLEAICPNVEIIIVGGGNVFDKLQEQVNTINEKAGRKLITLTGPRTDIDLFCAMSHVFVGVSRSVLEAMSCGKPVIVAGNEGYLGIFDESKKETGISTNFCCRGLLAAAPELLLADLTQVLTASEEQKKAWGTYNRDLICNDYSVFKMARDNANMYQASLKTKKWDAVISGYYGFGNSGDEALLSAMIAELKKEKEDINLCVLSANPKETEKEHGVPAVNRYHFFQMKKAIRKAKLLIFGGGSLLQDVTSSRSLAYYLTVIQTAQRLNVPVMLYANGIGPFVKEKNKNRLQAILSKVSCITLRERASQMELSKLGISPNKTHVTADPALTISPAPKKEVVNILKEEKLLSAKKMFAISVRPWQESDGAFYEKLAATLDELATKYNMLPVFVPMKHPEDYEISLYIQGLMQTDSRVIKTPYKASRLMGLFSRMEFVVAERLHSLIYAFNVAVPFIGLSYDTKVDAFMENVGQTPATDVVNFSQENIMKAAASIMENRKSMETDMKEKHEKLIEKARENAMYAVELMGKTEETHETDGN